LLAALLLFLSAHARAETTCGNTLAQPGPGAVCAVTSGTSGTLLRGRVILPADLYVGGEVLLDAAGTITCAACDCTGTAGYASATRIECPNGVISPGLIDAARLLSFELGDPHTFTAERYEHRHDWRTGANNHSTIPSNGSGTPDTIRLAELRALLAGTTSIVGSSGAAGLVRNLSSTANQGNLGQAIPVLDTFPLGDSNGTTRTSTCTYPNVKPVNSTVRAQLVMAEGIGETARNEFRCLSGQQAGAVDWLPGNGVDGAIALNVQDMMLMRDRGSTLVWQPRSNIAVYGDTARVSVLHRLGVPIAIGTDWLTTGSMNLRRELRCADSFDQDYLGNVFSDRALIDMVTRNEARLLAMDDAIGELSPGRVGDIAIFDAAVHPGYRAVIDAEPADVALVMRAGKPLYGDSALITALGAADCDAIEVCTRAKQACLTSEIQKSLAQLQADAGIQYPLLDCSTPVKEPTCTPARAASVGGSTIYTGTRTAGDSDGDGIANASDLCPGVFDPIRPLDAGAQADYDADGVGDACDACPQSPGNVACPPSLFADGFEP